jgi:hypothetical protein
MLPMIRASVLLSMIVLAAVAGCADDTGASDPAAAPAAAPAASAAPPVATGPAIDVPAPGEGSVRSGVPNPIELPPDDAPTPALAEGADIVYTCEDGSDLRVTYASTIANVTLSDGSIVALPRSPAATSEAGGEVYVGEAVGLRRIGGVVELQQDEGPTRRCREAGASA